jgi:hypothetical protein
MDLPIPYFLITFYNAFGDLIPIMVERHMLHCEIDHLVITTPSLETGKEYVCRELGVTPQVGGEHHSMGTHNCLVRLGEKVYLEVIAINPMAPAPNRHRFFGLDTLDKNAPSRLRTWVAHVDDIHAASAASPIPLGEIESMSRGNLEWLLTIPKDGNLIFDGLVPALNQWPVDCHPASRLSDTGCSLIKLEGFHPKAEIITAMLKAIGFNDKFTVTSIPNHEKPFLVAFIQTPGGIRKLSFS